MKKIFLIISVVIGVIILYFATMMFQGLLTFGGEYKPDDKMIITGHRGGAGYAPENTLEAISRSLDAGVKSIEIDVHLSKDGKIFVCHDNTVDRTTDGKGKIGDLTSEELRALHIVEDDGNVTDSHLPELYEVLDLIDGKAELLLEIKRTGHDNPGIEQAVVDQLEKSDAKEWTTIQSFNDSVLENLHEIAPDVRLEKLLFCKLAFLPVIFDGSFSKFSLEKYDYIDSFNFYLHGLSKSLAKKLHENGKKVRIWTLSDPSQIPSFPVDGVITDYPDKFMDGRNGE